MQTFQCPATGFFFFAHQARDFRRRPDEFDVAGLADFGEVGVLREQPIAGMNGVDVGNFGCADHGGDVQITLRELRRTNANGFVSKADVKRIAISFAVDGNGLDAKLFAGADDPKGDFSAISDEDLVKHWARAQAMRKKLLTAEIAKNSQRSQRKLVNQMSEKATLIAIS